ncbi:MAG: hypothetical protein PVG60_08220 [Desulfarculaceae bacterium]
MTKCGPSFPGGEDPPDHVITDSPMRLRWGDWRTTQIIQVHVGAAALYEHQRAELLAQGRQLGAHMPPHFVLDGALRDIALGLLRHCHNPGSQEEVVLLSALMEALVNTPCPILRTDLIRRVYQEVEDLSARLNLRFGGRVGRFLLPINEDAANPGLFSRTLATINDLQHFFTTLREIAEERYQHLRKDYVFYFPRSASL